MIESEQVLTLVNWTPAQLTQLIANQHPGVEVDHCEVTGRKVFGDGMVSSAGRVSLRLGYAGGINPDLPVDVIVKIERGDSISLFDLYENELDFYHRIRPGLTIETPRFLGGVLDRESGIYAMLLEDLGARRARFPNVTEQVTLEQMKSLIDTLAQLHSTFWESPRFAGDLAWTQTHLSGTLHDKFNNPSGTPKRIANQIETERFKGEFIAKLNTSASQLFAEVAAVQKHQGQLAQTLLHGDTHIGNTYLLPDGRGGLVDWQLSVRGYCMHDLGYLIVTGLRVDERRLHERDLLAYYRDRLLHGGVAAPPSVDQLWEEYRRAMAWNLYIGWLTTDVRNYGWEICVLNHIRLVAAYEDLETARAIAPLL